MHTVLSAKDEKFLNDPVIKECFSDLHKTWKTMEAAWKRGDYGAVSFRLGELVGTVGRVFNRNEQIDRGEQ